MSVRNLLRKANQLYASHAPHECRCPRAPEKSERTHGLKEVGRHNGPLLRARCQRCGGEYLLQIVEVIVEAAGEGQQP
jgi:hypothetical protein